jgi:peroxiredoxin
MFKNTAGIQNLVRGAIALLCLAFLAPAWANEAAPEFSLPTDQGEISLDALHGQVVYLDFWASWCVPCRKSFPWMNEMTARYKDLGFRIIAVNMDTDRSLIERFLEKYPADFTIAYNPEGDVAESYRVQGMPSSYLIDRQGTIHSTHVGFRDSEKAGIEAEIRALLK